MDRKAMAAETVKIIKNQFYETGGQRIDISEQLHAAKQNSCLILPEEAEQFAEEALPCCGPASERPASERPASERPASERPASERPAGVHTSVIMEDSVRSIHSLASRSCDIAVLNFASAKNPGGGFLNGAVAQEECITCAGALYPTLNAHPEYYAANRACGTMSYTDHAIYSPDVVFFRDEKGALLIKPSICSVLTMPAVNMGQVLQRGEDTEYAKKRMKHRMRLILSIFAHYGHKNLILGAYGCGVFRNDPADIAGWWKELLEGDFHTSFEQVVFAVYDRSKNGSCIRAFLQAFQPERGN